MIVWLAERRNRIAQERLARTTVLPPDGVLRLPEPMRWHSVRDLGGMSIISQRETAPWLWRAWRAFRYGEVWELNPEFTGPGT